MTKSQPFPIGTKCRTGIIIGVLSDDGEPFYSVKCPGSIIAKLTHSVVEKTAILPKPRKKHSNA